jgi:glycerophosphoryl diester phosphodiesterase
VAPENTLPAFRRAVELGVEMLEVDVQQTKDGQLVVLHDRTVDRTTDGTGDLRDFTLAELRALDAGSWFGDAFRGERVPTLAEVVSILDDKTSLLFEIKYGSPHHEGIEARLIEFIRQHRLERRVLIKSFDSAALGRVRALAPQIPLGASLILRIPFLRLIVHRGVRFGNLLAEDVDFLHVHRIGLTQTLVRDAHAAGLKVMVWDVHDEEGMREFIAMGVDAIETDESALLKQIRPGGPPSPFERRGK